MKEIESEKYIKQKLRSHIDFAYAPEEARKKLIHYNMNGLQKAFEDGYECATKWIDVKDRLPERREDVLVVMKDVDGFIHTEVRWRSEFSVVDVDENGFVIEPVEAEVLAWFPIPDYRK